MIRPEEVQKIILSALPDAEVTVQDQTGTLDHFQILVASPVFRGKTLVEQHLMVHKPLKPAIEDGRIHAVSIKTFTPE
jgi:acid stress-induced BolA-like protein IbaG/YrbA